MFKIIVDTREQHPWEFKSKSVEEVVVAKLDSGDYSIGGLEDEFAIERKGSTGELFKNITEKRFLEEIKRLSLYEKAFIVCEFSLTDIMDYPIGSGIPKRYWRRLRVKPQFVIKFLSDIQIKYNIHVIFAGNRENAIMISTSLMKEYYGNSNLE